MANDPMVQPMMKQKPVIVKPDSQSTLKELADLQYSAMYGVSKSFVAGNSGFINAFISGVQDYVSKTDQRIGQSTPNMLVTSVRTSMDEMKKKAQSDSVNQQQYISNVKGIDDQSRDMDLFREIYPQVTPMFELFYEYEMVCGMIPEAYRCFEILKNCVLSADNFTKKYLIPRYDTTKIEDSKTAKNESDNAKVKLLKDIVEEYDLDKKIEGYIEDGMKYGAKPVMIIPIDDTFRKSAERILKTENAQDIRSFVNSSYKDGKTVCMENSVEFESAFEDAALDKDAPISSFALNFESNILELANLYDSYLTEESSRIDPLNTPKEQMAAFEDAIKTKKKIASSVKAKTNRKEAVKKIAAEVSKIVNRNVNFTISSEAMSYKVISKVAGQTKTFRRYRDRNTTSVNAGMRFESANLDSEVLLKHEVDDLCESLNGSSFVVNESGGWDTVSVRRPGDSANVRDKTKGEVTVHEDANSHGSVIIPLAPDLVVPISVHGDHIGYYVIERTGNDDIGSGVTSLLGYRPQSSLNTLGMAGRLNTGTGSMVGSDGAGVILRDMVDLPMNARDDGRRTELLRGMLARAIAERVGNPDIVDDRAFNSIIYSLIKDSYITKKEIKITYVPAHMMVYFAHSIDKNTGVGESVFNKGLFFAHVYIASLITNLMINIAKSADREQINVEVGVNNRIEATVQKVMRTLQTKRASVDSIGNVDTIMRSLGTFQRYISLRHNGTPIVEMETIPGQQVDLDNSLQDKSLKSFINSFGIPHSALNFLEDTEYARSVSLQSGIFLTKVIDMQAGYQPCCTKVLRILVRNKYPDKIMNPKNTEKCKASDGKLDVQTLIDIQQVYLDLPAPNGLNITNMSEQIQNVGSYVDTFLDFIVPEDVPEDKIDIAKNQIKLGIMKMHLPNIPWDKYQEIGDNVLRAINKGIIKHTPGNGDDSGSGGDAGGGAPESSSDTGGDTGDSGGGDDFGDDGGFESM